MEIRFTVAQGVFGLVFGAVVAHYFDAAWWGYVLAIPAMGALAYYLSMLRLRRWGLKADATFVDYIEAMKRQWRQ